MIALEQGWSAETQDRVWFSSFGSRLVPYDWFLVLEQAGATERFRSDAHLGHLGFITQSPTPHNPDGLPVGFARDSDSATGDWVGLTCAACHTAELTAKGHNIRISGGQGLIDFETFEGELVAALKSTKNDDAKFQRFARALGDDSSKLRQALDVQLQRLQAIHDSNHTAYPYGYGRLDAFGQIFNAVAVGALGMAENTRSPDAPVSFPVLWRAPHQDVVQWNGSAPNAGPGPLFQNVTTALAVYGTIEVGDRSGHLGYPSSVDIGNLGFLQQQFFRLKSPQWPQDILGRLDPERLARGKQLYDKNCVSCHAIVDRNDAEVKIKATLIPAAEVGTDPRMVDNFVSATVKSGAFSGRRKAIYFGEELAPETNSIGVVLHAATGAVIRHPFESVLAGFRGYGSVYDTPLKEVANNYKARPLDGIWTAAPYLHNGSVPNLYEVLLPPAQRSTSFHVGNRELDTVKVGLHTTATASSSLFDTRLPGNANSGHLYGTHLTEAERWDLIEYLKSL
ncbi:c-type cytochrome [Exilibacterium tricleocarpae]|uniref:C-type cytochrome n=1 Tax=Exilibacterium tricleocarpae TaxID=2591008 RepID=A0A545U5U5_9GAMM|nr:c-type cytochrome [Exilibacterium tricleocarpae]